MATVLVENCVTYLIIVVPCDLMRMIKNIGNAMGFSVTKMQAILGIVFFGDAGNVMFRNICAMKSA